MPKPDIILIENFITNANEVYEQLRQNVVWHENFTARKTASYGVAYQYSGVSYEPLAFPPMLDFLTEKIHSTLGFLPNNCLINFYENGQSRMGFHVDDVSQMVKNTGVAIVSLGVTRDITFRLLDDKNIKIAYSLTSGSLLYMNDKVQEQWQHAILKDNTEIPRISLTFRQLNP